MMIKEILEKQTNLLFNEDIRAINKSLKLFAVGLYITTAMRSYKYIYTYTDSLEFLHINGQKDNPLLLLIPSVFACAGYFLLNEVSCTFRLSARRFMIEIEVIIWTIMKYFGVSHKSEITEKYQYNLNLLYWFEVKHYLDVPPNDKNKDEHERVRKMYEKYTNNLNSIIGRRIDVVTITILLSANFWINSEHNSVIVEHAKYFWSFIAGLVVWSSRLPYEDTTFLYIPNNKIRKAMPQNRAVRY